MRHIRLGILLGVLALLCAALMAAEQEAPSGKEDAPAGQATPAEALLAIPAAGGFAKVERVVGGILVKDVRITEVPSRDSREYRLLVRLRNTGAEAVTPKLRIVLWSAEKAEGHFDIGGGAAPLTVAARDAISTRGSVSLGADVVATRFEVTVPPVVRPKRRPSNHPMVGKEAPDFTLNTPEGEPVTLSALTKDNMVVLNFWFAG